MEENIISDFCEAWNTLNPDLILCHLSDDFEYDSQWTMETLHTDDYSQYLTEKFKTLQTSETKPKAEIIEDCFCHSIPMLRICQGKRPVYYRIKIKDGKVCKGDLCMF